MASYSTSSTKPIRATITVGDAASWYCIAVLVLLILMLGSVRDNASLIEEVTMIRGKQLSVSDRPCDEIYVVREGETLHTISDKCGDPFIVEQNPHINDPDDVFPGLVIKITPSYPQKSLHR